MFQRLKTAPDAAQDHHIHQRHRQQEGGGDGGANQAAGFVEPFHIFLKRRGGGGDGNGGQHHDGGVSEGKPCAHAGRALALLHHLTRHGINRGDMVGIHRMTQSVTPGQQAGRHQRRTAAKGVPRQPPGQQVSHPESQQQARCTRFIA